MAVEGALRRNRTRAPSCPIKLDAGLDSGIALAQGDDQSERERFRKPRKLTVWRARSPVPTEDKIRRKVRRLCGKGDLMRPTSSRLDNIVRDERVFPAVRNAFAVIGFFAVTLLVLDALALSLRLAPAVTDAMAHEVKLVAVAPAEAATPVVVRSTDPAHRAMTRYVARTYRIASEAAADVVNAVTEVGRKSGLDPALLLAIIAIESRFNPIAESDMGAKGLMQIIPKFHLDKLAVYGGEPAVLDPWTNVRVGAQILREYIARAGSLEAGLQWYNGAPNDENRAYAEKVLAERDRIANLLGRRPPPPKPPEQAAI